jgi:putative ABC transport system permease protein
MLTLKAFRDTLAHKGQFISLVVLIAIGIASYVTFQNGYYNLKASVDRAYTTLRFADFTVHVDRMPLSANRMVERIPGVLTARVRTVRDVGLELADGREATARVISSPGPSTSVNAPHVQSGRFPKPGARDEVLLSMQFSADTNTRPGDTLTLRIGGERMTVRVVGTGTDPEYLYAMQSESNLPAPGTFALIFVNETTVEHLFGTAHSGNEMAVRIKPGQDAEKVSELVEDELRPYGIDATAQRKDMPSYDGLRSELEQNRLMARSMPALILAISTMSLYIALSRMVVSQRGEIGLAKALGYSDTRILAHYLTIAAIIAVSGSVVGVLLGLWGAYGVASMYVSMLGLPFMTSGFYPSVVLAAVSLALASCFAGAAVPAWKSARLAPAIAMHSDPNRSLSGGRIPLVERLLSPVLPRSFTFRMPLRNVFRARRSLYTVLGIAFAMVLSVATLAMFDSIDYLIEKAFVHVERWDVMAAFNQPFGDSRVSEVRGMDGVKRVQPALVIPVTISAGTLKEDVAVTAMRPTADFHGFEPIAGAKPEDALAAGDIVLASGTAKRLGITIGARVEVDSPLVHDPVAMRVGCISNEMMGSPTYVSLDAGAALTGGSITSYNVMYVTADANRASRIRDEIYDMPGAASVQVKAGFVEQLKKWLELMDYFGTVLLGFGAALAFVVVFTTFTANVTERTREIATMRTIGEDNLRLTVMITLENLAITLAALPLGIWLGLRVTEAIFASFELEMFTLKAYIAPASIVQICALMLGVILLSEVPPVRRIFRLDLAAATKVME